MGTLEGSFVAATTGGTVAGLARLRLPPFPFLHSEHDLACLRAICFERSVINSSGRRLHEHTSWRVLKHSCGAVEKFIDSLMEAGFDILNPVQCTQKTLPFGTPREVRDQVLRRCEIFSRKGGFVFTTIHNVQARTPLRNFVAVLDAVREFSGAK